MALYKRSNSKIWWIRITVRGREVRRSTGTADKKLATEFEAKYTEEQWRRVRLGERPRYRWEQAVERYLLERTELPSLEDYKLHLRTLHQHLYGRFLDEIDRDLLDTVTQARKADGVSNTTVNRALETARAILRCAAREWNWLAAAPAVRMLPEAQRRTRWLTRDEADRLVSVLPVHLAEMVRFSLATGLRKGNVTGLQWAQVDLTRRVAWFHADQTKNKKTLAVPLNADAVQILRRQEGKHPTRVFTYRGKPVQQVNTKGWKAALTRGRHHPLPLARPEAHLGFMARAGRHPVTGVAGTGGLEQLRDGVAVCPPLGTASRRLRRDLVPDGSSGPHTFRHSG